MKVAIVGMAQSTHDDAPFDDPQWQCWGLALDPMAFRMLRLFEMHDRADLEARRRPEFWDLMALFEGFIYMQQEWPDIPCSVVYPLDQVIKDVFGGFPRARWSANPQPDWFNSSVAYMLALAIHYQARTIGLWGVDLGDDSEYAYERPCLEYLIGLAVGRGINVIIPEGPSNLGKASFEHLHKVYPRRYGYVT